MAARVAEDGTRMGALIAGRYSLGSQLGAGGAAVVWRGWDAREGLAVALKSPHMESADESGRSHGASPNKTSPNKLSPRRMADAVSPAELRWRLEREGRIMATLSHPHIARVYEYLEVEGRPWLALELIEGMDLWRAASERGPFLLRDALDVGRQVCAALAAIHAAGIIHRDIKPRNIILSPDGHATLIDFDLAWSSTLSDNGEPDMVYGTPEYMAPEQALGERITPATDLYALGVTLYELLAGRAPFRSSSADAIMWRHVTEPPPPLRDWRHNLPAPVERAVMRALAKEPRKRYPSAEAMEQALAQAADAARMARAKYGWRALPKQETRALAEQESRALPPLAAPQSAEDPVERAESASPQRQWLKHTFWALGALGLVLMLIMLLALAQTLPT